MRCYKEGVRQVVAEIAEGAGMQQRRDGESRGSAEFSLEFINNSSDALDKQWHVEVNKQAQPLVGEAQVAE